MPAPSELSERCFFLLFWFRFRLTVCLAFAKVQSSAQHTSSRNGADDMGAILTPAIEAIRKIAPTVNEHRTAHGCVGVALGELAVLANYTLDGFGEIELRSVSVSGHSVPPECFSPEQCSEWVREIKADRAEDDRMAADAAEYARWEQKQ